MDQDKETLLLTLAAGAASAFLYLLAMRGGLGSVLIAYTPLLPLFLAGLSLGPRANGIAVLAATFLAGIFTSLPGLMVYSLFYGVPTVFFIHAILTAVEMKQKKRWYPMGGVLTGLCLYSAGVAAIMIAITLQDVTSFAEILPGMKEDMPAWMEPARELLISSPFIIFALGAWIQIIAFYGIAVFANFMLIGWNRQIRENLTLTHFMPAVIVLVALLVAGLVSFSETLAVQIAGKTAFIILLLPYCLMGIARMHLKSHAWPQRKLWLFVIYLLTVLVIWPVFWFIGAGLYEQAKFLSNRYSSGTENESDK